MANSRISGRALARFPARVQSSDGVALRRQNGVYTFALDFGSLSAITDFADFDPAVSVFVIYDNDNDAYRTITGDVLLEAITDEVAAEVATATAAAAAAAASAVAAAASAASAAAGAANFSNRNYLDNTTFSILQYGPGPWTAGDPTFTCDRWVGTRFATAGATFTRFVAAAGARTPYGMRVQRDVSDTSTQVIALLQALDSARAKILVGKIVTLSYYLKAGANLSSTSMRVRSRIFTGSGFDEGFSDGYSASWTGAGTDDVFHNLTTTRTHYEHSLALGTGVNQVGFGLDFTPIGTAGADDYFEVDSIKLEISSASTLFVPKPDIDEFAECAAFYEDMARNPYTGAKDLRVIVRGGANGDGGMAGTDQPLIAAIRHENKRVKTHTLTVGAADAWHATYDAGSPLYDLEVDQWGHTTYRDSLLIFHYEIDAIDSPALTTSTGFELALDGGSADTKFAISCELAV